MVASDLGDETRAGRRFAALLADSPNSRLVAERALDHAMRAADWPLAIRAARRLDAAGALPALRRMVLAGEALKTRDWAGAERVIAGIAGDDALSLMAPALRAWRAYGMRAADPAAVLAPLEAGPLAAYAAEQRALLELAAGSGDGAAFLALSPSGGLRAQHLRLLAAAEFQQRGDRAKALALLAGDQPALAAARRLVEAGRPLPHRLDTAAEGLAEFLSRVAIDFGVQPQLRQEGVRLARLAAYLAPDSAQPAMIAAELAMDDDAALAARILATVPADSPFAVAARDLRLDALVRSGRPADALAEVTRRAAGSRAVADWIQLGELHTEGRRFDAAAEAYARAHELWRAAPNPAVPEWSLWVRRASALDQAGRWPDAHAALREAYRLAPTEPLVLNYLGYAQIDRGIAPEESEAMIREAARLAPDNAAITDSLGWALVRRGKLDEAIPLLERAARAEPADTEINEHLGDAYYAAGRRIEARFAWNAALLQAEGEAQARLRAKVERGAPPAAP